MEYPVMMLYLSITYVLGFWFFKYGFFSKSLKESINEEFDKPFNKGALFVMSPVLMPAIVVLYIVFLIDIGLE